MSFIVLIPKLQFKPTKLVDKKTGAFMVEQLLLIQHPDQFTPVQASVLIGCEADAHPVGSYELSSDSIIPGEYGRPTFRVVIGKKIERPSLKAAA